MYVYNVQTFLISKTYSFKRKEEEKKYIFANMTLQAKGGGLGGLRALADMSARNVSFLDGSPYLSAPRTLASCWNLGVSSITVTWFAKIR